MERVRRLRRREAIPRLAARPPPQGSHEPRDADRMEPGPDPRTDGGRRQLDGAGGFAEVVSAHLAEVRDRPGPDPPPEETFRAEEDADGPSGVDAVRATGRWVLRILRRLG